MNVLHIEVQDILLLGHLKEKEVKYNFEKTITLMISKFIPVLGIILEFNHI